MGFRAVCAPMRVDVRRVHDGSRPNVSGMTLMECVLATAMIAFALPGVMLVFAHSSSNAQSTGMNGEALRVIPQHVAILMRESLPDDVEQVIWAHAASGECLGRVESSCEQGLARHLDRVVRYLIIADLGEPGVTGMRPLRMRLEHPAAAPQQHRHRIVIHTRLNS